MTKERLIKLVEFTLAVIALGFGIAWSRGGNYEPQMAIFGLLSTMATGIVELFRRRTREAKASGLSEISDYAYGRTSVRLAPSTATPPSLPERAPQVVVERKYPSELRVDGLPESRVPARASAEE